MKTLEELKEEMAASGLDGYFDVLAPFAKESIRITLDARDEDAIPMGASKFGGCPDLPGDVAWFRREQADIPLSFIGQVNFAEIAPFDLEHKLPERGMLYFFYDCSPVPDGMPWGFDPEDSDGWKVYFYDGDMSALFRKTPPADLEENENGVLFGSAGMRFETAVELPSPESDLTSDLDFPDDDELQDRYWEWSDEHTPELSNKLLGHSDNVQGGMELECEYVTHGNDCGTPDGYRVGKSKGLDKNAARWNLLLQVDSNEDIGMMWCDAGRLYFWITDEDLASRAFENCWLILQCG